MWLIQHTYLASVISITPTPTPPSGHGGGWQEYSEQLNIFYSLTLSLKEVRRKPLEKVRALEETP